MSSRGLAEVLPVGDDAERPARFYGGIFGQTPESPARDGRARFRAGRPGRSQRAALREGDRLGKLHHVFEALHEWPEAAAKRVRACGVEIHGPTRFGWMRATSHYFYGPGGNFLEIPSPDPGNDYKETD